MDFDYIIALNLFNTINNTWDEKYPFHNSYENILNFNSQNKESPSKKLKLIDPLLELKDPNPDIFNLFLKFNNEYFYKKLDAVEVKWSYRMTLYNICAGTCTYQKRAGHCSIHLSHPLLKFRPRKDLIETLLHEMIHAYLFVTNNYTDRDSHGPEFNNHMKRINESSGTNITIYHSFHREVNECRKHWWRCTGSCKERSPYFGYVKRAMNRAPSNTDFWWPNHARSCNGEFVKVKEPAGFNKHGQSRIKHKEGEVGTQTSPPKIPFRSNLIPIVCVEGKQLPKNQEVINSKACENRSQTLQLSSIPGLRAPIFNKKMTDFFTPFKKIPSLNGNSKVAFKKCVESDLNSHLGDRKVSSTANKPRPRKKLKLADNPPKNTFLQFIPASSTSSYQYSNNLLKDLHQNNIHFRSNNIKIKKDIVEIQLDSD